MSLYRQLSQIGFLKKSYAFKFLFVAFFGIHIPLIGLIFFVLFSDVHEEPALILLFTLVLTLLATAITLILLRKLTWPVSVASEQLEAYRRHGTLPDLPRNCEDEAGVLMRNIQITIEENHDMGSDKLDLIYLLSHDLRNFAANSQALAQLIQEERDARAIEEYAALIVDTSQQQFHFLEDFIRLIKDEEEISRKVPVMRKFEVSEILSVLNREKGSDISKKALALVVEHNVSHIQLPVEFELLMRVLVNLVDNAIKFSDRGSCIRIKFHEDKFQTSISVSDDGIGFDASQADLLFRKFTPMARKGTEREPSTGIGLYLCRKIVEKYDGKLIAESRGAKRGATFRVVFGTGKV